MARGAPLGKARPSRECDVHVSIQREGRAFRKSSRAYSIPLNLADVSHGNDQGKTAIILIKYSVSLWLRRIAAAS